MRTAGCIIVAMIWADSTLADDGNTLDTLSITASDSTETTGDVVTDEHTGNVSRINREQIERSASQLGDLLSTQVGIQQRQSAGFGSFSTISLRAAGGAQIGMYLDGVLLNSSGNPIVDLSTLEVLNFETVDVYRGVTPLQLGHGSIGGAVNLKSLSLSDSARTRVRLGVGSFSQTGLQLAHQSNSSQWDWTGALSHRQSDNDFDFLNDNRTELNPHDDVLEPRFNNQVQRTAGLLKAGFQATPTQRTDVILQISERQAEIPDFRNAEDNQAKSENQSSQLQLSQVIDQWNTWNTRHSVYWHQFDADYTDLQGTIDGQTAFLIRTESRTLGAKTYWERFFDFGTTGISFEIREETLDSVDLNTRNNNFSASRELMLGTAHLALIDDSDRWLVSPAIRWQHSDRTGPSNQPMAAVFVSSSSETDVSAQLGMSFQASRRIKLNANIGRYFREPSFGELYQSFGLVRGNALLVPEEGNNVDVGLHYSAGTLSIAATAFHNQRDELIVTNFNGRGVGRLENTGEAFVNGLELSTTWQPTTRWEIQANATIQNPRTRDDNASFENRQLPGEARRLYFARVAYQPSPFSIWYEWTSHQGRFYDKANILPAQDSSVHNIGLNWHNDNWQLSTRIHNALDEAVEDFNGFAKPGRFFSVALTRNL